MSRFSLHSIVVVQHLPPLHISAGQRENKKKAGVECNSPSSCCHQQCTIRSLLINSCTPDVFNSSASHRRLLSKQCSLLYIHNAQQLTTVVPLIPPVFQSLSLRYQQIFGAIILAKFSPSSWVLLMRRSIRQMLSVSANQVPRLAIKSAQVASVQNELLATTEC